MEIGRFEKRIALSEKKTPLVIGQEVDFLFNTEMCSLFSMWENSHNLTIE